MSFQVRRGVVKGALVVSSTMSLWSSRAFFVISLLSFAGFGAGAAGQEDQSGASAGRRPEVGRLARVPVGFDDALTPIDVRAHPGSNAVGMCDTAAVGEPVDSRLALWQQLASLDQGQRANAEIELELGAGARDADRAAAARIADLWNSGAHDAALAQLRALENAGVSPALGITWRVPLAWGSDRMNDVRVGDTRTEAQAMNIDFDAQTGYVFAIVRWGSTTGTSAWTMNISTDGGITWSESYAYASSVGLIDVDCAVVDDYVYVAYVAGNAADEARMRRCLVSTGGIDGSYGFHVVFDAGANTVEEVALAANANDFDNRIYYAIIQSNDVLRYAHDVASDGTTFNESSPVGANPEFGLDMTWDNGHDTCTEFLYVSYAGNDGHIHVLGRSESAWTAWTVETGSGSFRTTAVSAYNGTIICAFEYPYTYGTGIRYRISYDCGASWSPGSLAVPDGATIFGYFKPDVDARSGHGTAIIYQAEAGELDPMYCRTRAGFAPGAWSDAALFSDHDVYTGSDTALGYLPPLAGEAFSYGALYLSLDPDFRTPYFDRPAASGAACGDTTPPAVSISAPAALACACDLVDIVGAVNDPDGTYVGDRLEVRQRGTSAWAVVDAATGARSGVLYTWNTAGLPQDFYDVRVVGQNECGLSNSDSVFIYKPTSFDTLELRTPVHGGVYGGSVSLDGTAASQSCFANYTVSYRPAAGGTYNPVDPLHPTYTSAVINDPLALWNTVALGVPDGDYTLRVGGETTCGNAATETIVVTVDNTPPVAYLSAPASCAVFAPGTSVAIEGEVLDANLEAWTLAVTGGPYTDWHTIAGPTTSNASGVLLAWDTSGLPTCSYTIRLQALDKAVLSGEPSHRVVEAYTSIELHEWASADLDGDGDVDIADLVQFQLTFTGPLP